MKHTLYFLTLLLFFGCAKAEEELPLPNILWITSEDNSPIAGCYGDEFATTPNMDALAAEGFLYTHAYANVPVCAPARNTILTGIYAISGGNQHMRSYYDKSDEVKFYPQMLREAGYYATNNSKEDYNINPAQNVNIWDDSSKDAHYKNRPEGKPFFAVFNSTISHESSIHKSIPNEDLRHSPEEVTLPPYHPDTPEMRHDWAQYYDKVEDMDKKIGEILQELEESGEAENTIVFYYGDHGGVLARSKRYVYETGTRVPFIVRIPEKYKHLFPSEKPGDKVDRMISFVDLFPTLLSIIGTDIPDYLQGKAFLGEKKTPDPEYVFMFRGRMDERYDMSRAVRDQKFRYIRNYIPYRVYGQYLEYLFRAPSIRSWQAAFKAGELNPIQSAFWNTKPAEELYDTENDPWEVNNLANDPEYREVLERMRGAAKEWMLEIHDTGFIPEAELIDRTAGTTAYDYMRNSDIDLEQLIEAANLASTAKEEDLSQLMDLLNSEEAAKRYWGATGLLILGEKARPALGALEEALNDSSPNVKSVAAEALYGLGAKEKALQALAEVLMTPNSFARTHALNVIDSIEDESKTSLDAVIAMVENAGELDRSQYDLRAARGLLEKWNINPSDYGFDMDW
ncbi:MAG: sulfatase-like hydrolase/transferase [Cytophagales bacterium]|uniref:sulfatase-like hydrolase/transferase n=1 Tax=Cyclobacterium marinum TaxID=104 RepID=UPI0030D6D2F8|nr:sulfatase-like hydrolase/transferase [Cytophagales bacterium]|tara:strand:- start:8342 stop:10216 length:1875 start_codon:yes stop_codon:yes gene_type:complete